MDWEIKVTLSDGRKILFRKRNELSDIDPSREAEFFMDDLSSYHGYCKSVDDDEFILSDGKGRGVCIGLPTHRLVGWCYTDKIETEEEQL